MDSVALDLGERVATGRTSALYALGTDSVVKVPRPEVPDQWLQLEAELTIAVRKAGVPAPEVRDVVRWNNRIAVVFERVDGPSMWQQILADPASAPRHATDLVHIHAEVLAMGVPSGLPDFVDRMQRKIAQAEQLTAEERTNASTLTELLPRGAALLHGDLHPGNILLGSDGPVLIDWFDAAIGHPAADISRSSLLMEPSATVTEHLHLVDSTPPLLAAVHQTYLDGMAPLLGECPQWADWCAVTAASRLSEGAHVDESVLITRWRQSG